MIILKRFARGATQPGFVDILAAVILLAILLYAATVQFAVYTVAPAAPTSSSTTGGATSAH